MNRKLNASFIAFLICSVIVFASCLGGNEDTDGTTGTVTPEWRAFQKKVFEDSIATGKYTKVDSQSENGSVYYKTTSSIKSAMETRVTSAGYPTTNDTVVCRYTGWYVNEDGKSYIFDSTEGDSNKQNGVEFVVNNQLVDGFMTMLQNMKQGEERTVFFNYRLGYGPYDTHRNNVLIMRGNTTLFFTIKMLKLKPVNPNEF